MNAAINNSIIRESQWTHKRSTVIACETVHKHALNLYCPEGEMADMQDNSRGKENVKLSHDMKASVKKKVFSDLHEEQKNTWTHSLSKENSSSFQSRTNMIPTGKV